MVQVKLSAWEVQTSDGCCNVITISFVPGPMKMTVFPWESDLDPT